MTKETQWADPRIAYQLQQHNEKALPVSSYNVTGSYCSIPQPPLFIVEDRV